MGGCQILHYFILLYFILWQYDNIPLVIIEHCLNSNICHSVISSQYFSHLFLHFLVCNKVKCGDQGCLKGDTNVEQCCNEECLGGCFALNSHHCYACKHLREMSNGKCVKKCQSHLYEVKYLIVAGELIRGAAILISRSAITHAWHVCSLQLSFGLPLRMYEMHWMQFDQVCLDLLSLLIWSPENYTKHSTGARVF